MAIQIQFRRGTASEWSSVNPILAEAEMGLETDTELFKIGNGVQTWNDLAYGGIRGFTGSVGPVGPGNIAVQNVLYVSKSGDDSFDGRNLASSKLTIEGALAIATLGTTIFVKSGDYIENNPLVVPEGVAVVGDNLRTVTVRPVNKTLDLFWVTNGVYLQQMTFKDHEAPAAAVAFPSDITQGTVIHTSPYVQNCTSMTTTGTGMRVDGAHVNGLKSMVVDAFTQYNQGGIGIHMLNRGNTQLVSVFTICCDVGFLCESGGFCSVTNSNSSFGNYALKADGVSETLYTAKTVGATSGDTFVLDNLIAKPNIGDAVKFVGDNNYYTVSSASTIQSANATISYPNYNTQSANAKNARQTVLDLKSKIQTDVIDFLNETYPSFEFNQFKATRDAGLIIDAIVDDMVFETNYKSVLTGKSFYRNSSAYLIANQKTETLASLNFLKAELLGSIANSSQSPEYQRIENNINTILDILENGVGVPPPTLVFSSPVGVNGNLINAKDILQENKNFLIEEGIAYITENYSSLTYNETKCRADIEFIIDAITYDIVYSGNSQTVDAADEYYSGGYLVIPSEQRIITGNAYRYIKSVAEACVLNTPVTAKNQSISQNTSLPAATNTETTAVGELFDIVIDLVENAYSSTIVLEETVNTTIADNADVTFHQYSLITSSGHTFEWIGAGTNVNTALPYLGGTPVTENQVIEINGGKVYYTGTDQRGDFRIGNDLVINRNTGTISGRTFTKSLFAVMTPYILAIGE